MSNHFNPVIVNKNYPHAVKCSDTNECTLEEYICMMELVNFLKFDQCSPLYYCEDCADMFDQDYQVTLNDRGVCYVSDTEKEILTNLGYPLRCAIYTANGVETCGCCDIPGVTKLMASTVDEHEYFEDYIFDRLNIGRLFVWQTDNCDISYEDETYYYEHQQ